MKKGKVYGPGKGELLDPDQKKSLFKVKIWFNNGRECQRFSKDFELERLQFEACKELLQSQFQRIGAAVFEDFNGFRNIQLLIKKIDDQGKLQHAQIYCNQIKQPNPKISFEPMPILLANYSSENPSPLVPEFKLTNLDE